MTKYFNYKLTGTGWAEATFTSDKQSVAFESSYLSDPLADLFVALNRVADKQTTFEKIVFAEEPGEHKLQLTSNENGKLIIEIFWSDEWEELFDPPKEICDKKLVYSDNDTLENFIRVVCTGINNLLDTVSLKDYKKLWCLYQFPIDSYTTLKRQFKSTV